MIYDITSSDQVRDLSASDLALTRCEHLMLTPPKQKCTILTHRSMTNMMVLKSRLCAVFWQSYFSKPEIVFWPSGHLTWPSEATSWPETFKPCINRCVPGPVTAHMLVFPARLAQLRRGSRTRPLSRLGRRYVKKKLRSLVMIDARFLQIMVDEGRASVIKYKWNKFAALSSIDLCIKGYRTIGGGTGRAPGHRAPFNFGILTLALWALHGKNRTESRQCPPPLNWRCSAATV